MALPSSARRWLRPPRTPRSRSQSRPGRPPRGGASRRHLVRRRGRLDQVFCIAGSDRLFATDGHLVAARHLKNVEWWGQWGQQESRPKLEGGQEWSKGPPDFWGNPAHFEWRNGWWWCLLCEQCADGPHTQGQKHRRALGWGPGNILTNGVPGVARNDACEPLAEPEPCGAVWDRSRAHAREGAAAASSAVFTDPWQASYSRDHDRLLYYNSETGERSWTAPSQADTEGAAAWESPWPGRS
mmetsp:Transcript_42450/g.121453  ORF Transcript_42450/g.121453 Transcript_42450/m.121453 type:complete len:241 (+) Transcript_42450:94-816(+)